MSNLKTKLRQLGTKNIPTKTRHSTDLNLLEILHVAQCIESGGHNRQETDNYYIDERITPEQFDVSRPSIESLHEMEQQKLIITL